MLFNKPDALTGYIVVLAVEFLFTFLLLFIDPYIPISKFQIPYALIVMLAAYYYGVGATLLSIVFGMFLYEYFFFNSRFHITSANFASDFFGAWLTFVLGGVIIGCLTLLIRRLRLKTNKLNSIFEDELKKREGIEDKYKQLSAASDFERSQLETVLNCMAQGVITLDAQGRIMNMNPAAVGFFNCTVEDAENNRLEDLCEGLEITSVDGTLILSINDFIRRVIAGEKIENLELHVEGTKYRDSFVGSFSASPVFDKSGGLMQIVILIRDITAHIALEKREEELEKCKMEFYHRTIYAATNGRLIISDDETINKITKNTLRLWAIKDSKSIINIRHEIAGIADKKGMDKSKIDKFIISIGEVAANACKYAGGSNASIHELPDGLIFKITDTGPGIDEINLPEVALRERFSTSGTLGMGYKVMLSCCDKVYLSTGSKGTTVALQMNYADSDSLYDC